MHSLMKMLHTLRLLRIPSNCPAVFSPMLCEPHNSKPILAYVNVIDPIGKTYVNIMKITLYLKNRDCCILVYVIAKTFKLEHVNTYTYNVHVRAYVCRVMCIFENK